jgi:hypothetical protein
MQAKKMFMKLISVSCHHHGQVEDEEEAVEEANVVADGEEGHGDGGEQQLQLGDFLQNLRVLVTVQSFQKVFLSMERHPLKNVNNYLNTNNYSYLETSGGQISNLYLNVVHFFNASVT